MHLVLGANGPTPLEGFILALFIALFAWIALALVSGVCGFVSLLASGGQWLEAPGQPPLVLMDRTALLMPAYNESPARIAAALEVMHGELKGLGVVDSFDFFILSDTTDPDAWVAEEQAFLALRQRTGSERIFYRRRVQNVERKAGNIAEWVRRFGRAYQTFLILDADSVMTGECILHLTGLMQRHPSAGLIQTLPIIVGGQTLFARMQQFAGRVYGPLIAHGITWWHGAEGNYWGHNAMIRTRAFAEAAGLPSLRGRKPFGGHIMSHDFVEAALLRRAGWGVHMLPMLRGSYEESPPSLAEVAVRDRRWCQGNLQHIAVLPARGLHVVSRLHLLMGIGSYITAPMWLLFLVCGILISLQARFVVPVYFPVGPSLFPQWPVVDPVRSMWVFIGTMAVLLGPKLLAYVALLFNPIERQGCGGALRALLSMLVETVLAGLIAPIAMLTQSVAVCSILLGRDGGWHPQRRDDGRVPARDVMRQYWPHTCTGLMLGLAAWLVSPSLALWMSPVVLGLTLAIPLAMVTARRNAGMALRRAGILQTPEEADPPAALHATAQLACALNSPQEEAFCLLLRDPALLTAHLAMLPLPRQPGEPWNAALLVGLGKLDEATTVEQALGTLTRAEKMAILTDAKAIARVGRLPWR